MVSGSRELGNQGLVANLIRFAAFSSFEKSVQEQSE